MIPVDVGVVIPLRDEEAVVQELARRCAAALEATGLSWELLLVDDGSRDGTARLAGAAGVPLRLLHLHRSRGQWGATRAGLARCTAPRVVVLDGDLQDPPELIPRLLAAGEGEPHAVVFAVKASREDPWWIRAGSRACHAGLALLDAPLPRGAGSYCLLPGDLARRLARLDLADANLAAAVVALGARFVTVPYHRGPRAGGRSRAGLAGLVREALGSLWLVSPPGRRLVARRCGGAP
ncbi:MAG: glycosyltransferase [Deltaproteobacteria bacterium]|nr:glycosyltransferase [Deltaproteobacteria bacterium]